MDPSAAELDESVTRLQSDVAQLVVPRHCSGTFPLEEGKAGLFFKKDDEDNATWLDFGSKKGVEDAGLEKLVAACAPAKFGRGNKDVLDESYRKAWKLDASRFALQFDVIASGILQTVHDALLQYADSTLVMEAHLDKLNVYGPGSFFKAHVDTPRHPNMLATLVIVLPTEHEGGDLLLLGKPWTFDSSKLVAKGPSDGTPHLAFVAFYSDIEHEVTPVISGYRVTVTYNLYCSKPLDPVGPNVALRPTPEERAIRDSLRQLLSNEKVMPHGGILGFSLTYKYPVTIDGLKNVNEVFEGRLKGSDALIERACKGLGFQVQVRALYREGRVAANAANFLSTRHETNAWVVDSTNTDGAMIGDYEEAYEDWMGWFREHGAEVKDVAYQRKHKGKKPIVWVTRPRPLDLAKAGYLAYGNEASLAWFYGTLVLAADVPSYAKRQGMVKGTSDAAATEGEGGAESDSESESDSDSDGYGW